MFTTHQILSNWPNTPHTPLSTPRPLRDSGLVQGASGRPGSQPGGFHKPKAAPCSPVPLHELPLWLHFTGGKAGPQNLPWPKISGGCTVRVCPHTHSPLLEPTVHTTRDTYGWGPGVLGTRAWTTQEEVHLPLAPPSGRGPGCHTTPPSDSPRSSPPTRPLQTLHCLPTTPRGSSHAHTHA